MDEALLTLAEAAGRALLARGLTLASAESCTGGLVAAALTAIPGSSRWFERGFVAYSYESKVELLGVRPETLVAEGAVSEATVREMAAGALARSRADLAVAASGVAGPGGGSPAKPVGTVCLAWASRDGVLVARTLRFAGDRASIRRQTALAALEGLRDFPPAAIAPPYR